MKTDIVYLDNSATTSIDEEVWRFYTEAMKSCYGNPSSLHGLGTRAEHMLEEARKSIAAYLGVKASEVVFTSGGTESNNTAIFGVARRFQSRGKHLVTTQVEHPSVLESFRALEREGYEVTYVAPDKDGRVSSHDVLKSMRSDTTLVSVMHVNNETGAVQPVDEIAAALKEHKKVLFHVDAVQSYGRLPIPIRSGIDLVSASAHKIHGPTGVGLLFIREGCQPYPLLYGGGQEKGRRSGTENAPGAAAFALATRRIAEMDPDRLKRLQSCLIERLDESALDLVWNTPTDGPVAPHIVNASFPGTKGEVVVHSLEERGIYVSTGSACSSRQSKGSHVLKAMGRSDEAVAGSIRFSFSYDNTLEEVEFTVETLADIVRDLRMLSRN